MPLAGEGPYFTDFFLVPMHLSCRIVDVAMCNWVGVELQMMRHIPENLKVCGSWRLSVDLGGYGGYQRLSAQC